MWIVEERASPFVYRLYQTLKTVVHVVEVQISLRKNEGTRSSTTFWDFKNLKIALEEHFVNSKSLEFSWSTFGVIYVREKRRKYSLNSFFLQLWTKYSAPQVLREHWRRLVQWLKHMDIPHYDLLFLLAIS